MYEKFFKRFLDFSLSLIALIVLSPLLLILTITGAIAMKGNPFFVQKRVGMINKRTRKAKIFPLIKFRTMSNEKNSEGSLLPNDQRLNKYGRILRVSSLDELPEIVNIFVGHLSFVGPRPLLVEYLPYYTGEEYHRHDLRPGLTGLAQINGRNNISSWDERFAFDLEYINNCSFLNDIKISYKTIGKVLKRSDVLEHSQAKVGRLDQERRLINEQYSEVGGK